jgi:hypothetical protein
VMITLWYSDHFNFTKFFHQIPKQNWLILSHLNILIMFWSY